MQAKTKEIDYIMFKQKIIFIEKDDYRVGDNYLDTNITIQIRV